MQISPPLERETLYQRGIALAILDPAERANYAAQALAFNSVNDAAVPQDADNRERFLADLARLILAGEPGDFRIVEENLRELYLVDIGGGHRISRKVYATHPRMPGMLYVIGGLGIVRPDAANGRLTLATPKPTTTLHQLFPDLPRTAMSAGCPTPHKSVASVPNIDPVGGYSARVAQRKYRYVEMIAGCQKGIDPLQFPIVTNVAWGLIGQANAFYVYAVPDTAVPICETLQAQNEPEMISALGRYLHAGQQLMRALKHLHNAGYVFNQAHQGNVYYYQDHTGQGQILISDLDMLHSIQDFSKIPGDSYLSPRAFAALVNIQVASTNIAQIAWIHFFRERLAALNIAQLPGLDKIYASIIFELLAGYIDIPDEAQRRTIYHSLQQYFCNLARQGASGTAGIARLVTSDLYETDVFGFLFTRLLMDNAFCSRFGAKCLMEGTAQGSQPGTSQASAGMQGKTRPQTSVSDIDQAVQRRANEAMREYLQGFTGSRKLTGR